MSEPVLRIHFIVADPEGPIHSGGMTLNLRKGPQQVAAPGRFRAACDPKLVIGTEFDRGTGEPWNVQCSACEATEIFQANNRPHPRLRAGEAEQTANAKKNAKKGGCCG